MTKFRNCQRLKASQNILIDQEGVGGGGLIIVQNGIVMMESGYEDGRRQVLGFRFPSDVIVVSQYEGFPAFAIIALTDAELERVEFGCRTGADEVVGDNVKSLCAESAYNGDCPALQALVLGRLNSEERIASFLLEMVLRTGRQRLQSIEFSLPMKRDDIADYLCINPDTVSRLLSQFRREHIIDWESKRTATVHDLDALNALTPLSKALIAHYGDQNELSRISSNA